MWRVCCSVSAGLVGIIFLVLGILVACLFDPFVNSSIDKELILKDDPSSKMYKLWAEPPVVPYLRIYFFNLTNRDDFMNAKVKPIFEEVGPFSYREKWKKVNIKFHDNGTVTYSTKKEFYFDRNSSIGSEDEMIRTLNVPVNIAVQKVAKMGKIVQLGLSSFLATLNETAFVDKTVKQLVWGYKDRLMEIANKYLPKDRQLPFDKFGFFYLRNGSTDGLFNVFTGAHDINKYTMIDTFNLTRELSYWETPECNKIQGTDGTSYPPHLKKEEMIYIFNENLCRSLPLQFNNTNKHYDIESYRYVPPADVFAGPKEKPENACFCHENFTCLEGGVFDIGACKFNVSTILSWPHFYRADEKFLDALEGLHPDPLKHSFYVDINPKLGIPLAAQIRIQINFMTMNSSYVKPVANMTPMLFPVLWFEDGVDKLPPSIVEEVQMPYFVIPVVKTSLLCLFFILGLVLLAVGISTYVMSRKKTSKSSNIEKTDSGHVNPAMSSENPD